VDILVEINNSSKINRNYVIQERSQSVLYVQMLKAHYGMMVSSLLYYKNFSKDMESIRFEFNPYDMCVANWIINSIQHTITQHVDDVKSSHEDTKVDDELSDLLKDKYANDNIGKVNAKGYQAHLFVNQIGLYYSRGSKGWYDWVDKVYDRGASTENQRQEFNSLDRVPIQGW